MRVFISSAVLGDFITLYYRTDELFIVIKAWEKTFRNYSLQKLFFFFYSCTLIFADVGQWLARQEEFPNLLGISSAPE